MKKKSLLINFFILLFPILLGFTRADCSLLNIVFFSECSPEDSYFRPNSAGFLSSSEFVQVGDSGRIYVESQFCRSGYELFLVSGEPDLNSIYGGFISHPTSIIVGDNGTIIRNNPNISTKFVIISSPTSDNLNFVSADFFPEYFIIVGDNGTILKSTDDGESWNHLNSPVTVNLKSCSVDGDTIIITGEDYTLFKSTDSGNNWFPIGPSRVNTEWTQSSYNKIYFYNDTLGYVGGPHGLILKTTDGGNNWQTLVAQGFSEVNDLFFISPDSGVAVGPGGTARFTTDGGSSWFEDSTVTAFLNGRDIKKIVPFSRDYGIVIGSGGLSTFIAPDSTYLDSAIVTSVNEFKNQPDEFILYQNYPNPFNPETKIEFYLPEISFVTLKIYDALGREVSTLLNDERSAGKHSINFDASYLSSGIYFYRLLSDDRTETKKLLLLK